MRALIVAVILAGLLSPSSADAQSSAARVDEMAISLLTLREAAGLSISPNGRQVAFQVRRADQTENTYHAEWRVLDIEHPSNTRIIAEGGGAPFGTSPYNQQRMAVWLTLTPRWSPDGQWIAYLRSDGGQPQIWRARADGGGAQQITHEPGGIVDFVWSDDGSALVFDPGRSTELLRAALDREARSGFLFDGRFDPVSSWAPVRHGSEVPDPPCCRVVDVAHGVTRDAIEAEIERYGRARPLSGYNAAPGMAHMWTMQSMGAASAVSPFDLEPEHTRWRKPFANGSAIAFALSDSTLRGRSAPVRLHLREDERAPFVPCAAEECSGWLIDAWRTDNGDVVFLRREGWAFTTFSIYRWQPSSDAVRQLSSTLDIWYDCQQAHRELVCFTEGSRSPQTLVALDMETGAVRRLLDLNPDFDRNALAPAERLEWRSPLGNPDYAYFVRPRTRMPRNGYPLVIVHYRPRGFLRGGSGDFSPIQAYAAAGIAVLAVDRPEDWDLAARAEQDDEIEVQQFTGLRQRRDIFDALEIALDGLVARGDVDATRIGISGLSDGSASAAFAINHSNRFRAASISGGAWEPILFLMSSPQQRAFYTRLGLGAPGTRDDVNWDALSMARNAERITTPLLIQTADSELGMILEPLVMLQTHGKPVEAYVFPDEYHVPWQPAHRLAMYRRNVDWFRFWLQDFEDPSPEKADQYARWRAMRPADVR
ncbi:MAG: Atxe2 family lasso peptide isopeptidase [Hyphomonadaceae bacterium]